MTAGPALVVIGSLHHDIMVRAPHRPEAGETVTGSAWFPKFGGKGGNQAIAAAKAGAEVRFVGAVGRDGFGDFMIARLAEAKVATDRIARLAGVGSGISVAIEDTKGEYGAVIVSGANLNIEASQFSDPALWQGASVLILQNEVPEPINIAAAQAAASQGVPVCLNAAPSRAMSGELADLVDIMIVNAFEARDLTGMPVDDLESAQIAARALAGRFPLAIATAGGAGAAFAQRNGTSGTCPAVAVDLVSTHGAGDVFVGTFCALQARGVPVNSAVSGANTAAARHVSTPTPID